MSESNNALATVRSVEDMMTLGKAFALSGICGCDNEEQGLVLVMTCMSENISPIKFSQTYHIIDGKISMKADAMAAKFIERGGEILIEERSDTRAAATFVKGKNKLKAEITLEDAKKSGYSHKSNGAIKDNWARIPKQMLWARLCSDTIRAIDPGVNHGTYTPEEIMDIKDPAPISGTSVRTTATIEAVEPEVIPPENPAPMKAEAPKDDNPVDFNIVPFGKAKGKTWKDIGDAILPVYANREKMKGNPEMQEGHFAAIAAEIAARAEAKAKGGAA